MDFDQLVTFLEVAKLGSFSRAGQKVFRSQSAVSAERKINVSHSESWWV
jgi:DNA-binding transcriptional LysR family regulator